MQIITPSGSFFIEDNDISMFRADAHDLEIRNYFPKSQDYFRLTSSRASGRANSGNNEDTQVEFDLDITPTVGWGGDVGKARQYSTAGWLAAFPIFEPHYQVLISNGIAKGPLNLYGNDGANETYDLTGASVYLEKNWGGSFPSKWWWLQANTGFENDLCVTSTGARRRLPLLKEEEEVALVALHWNGEFLPFPEIDWDVQWGQWTIRGRYENYYVEIDGSYDGNGFPVKCPTVSGMEDMAFETFNGLLHVKLYQNGNLVLEDSCDEACLEVGGTPWSSKNWTGQSAMKEPIKSVAMNVDLERRASDLLALVGAFVEIPGL